MIISQICQIPLVVVGVLSISCAEFVEEATSIHDLSLNFSAFSLLEPW